MSDLYSVVVFDFTNQDSTDMTVKAAVETIEFTTAVREEASRVAELRCQELVEQLEETDGVDARWESIDGSHLIWMTKGGSSEEITAYQIEIEESDGDEVEVVDTDVSVDDLL